MEELDIFSFGQINQEDLHHLMYLKILMGTVTFLFASYIGLLGLQCAVNKWYGRRLRYDIHRGSAVCNETECVLLQEVSRRESREFRQKRRESWHLDNVGTYRDRQELIPHDNQHSEEKHYVNMREVPAETDGQEDMSLCINLSERSSGNVESELLPFSRGSCLNEGVWENNALYVGHVLHGQSETVM